MTEAHYEIIMAWFIFWWGGGSVRTLGRVHRVRHVKLWCGKGQRFMAPSSNRQRDWNWCRVWLYTRIYGIVIGFFNPTRRHEVCIFVCIIFVYVAQLSIYHIDNCATYAAIGTCGVNRKAVRILPSFELLSLQNLTQNFRKGVF